MYLKFYIIHINFLIFFICLTSWYLLILICLVVLLYSIYLPILIIFNIIYLCILHIITLTCLRLYFMYASIMCIYIGHRYLNLFYIKRNMEKVKLIINLKLLRTCLGIRYIIYPRRFKIFYVFSVFMH